MIKINKIGTKIYYLKNNGTIILKTGDMRGWVIETTFDEDYENYSQLSQYNKDKIGLIQLQYRELGKLLKEHKANSYKVDVSVEPHKFIFDYIDYETGEPTEPPVDLHEENEKLKGKVKEIEKQLENTNEAVQELMLNVLE